MTMQAEIETHYSERQEEATRLSSTLNSRLEQARIQELLARYLPEPPAEVADLGGGPGDRATWLTSQGYTVEFLDPVPHNIEQATAAGDLRRTG